MGDPYLSNNFVDSSELLFKSWVGFGRLLEKYPKITITKNIPPKTAKSKKLVTEVKRISSLRLLLLYLVYVALNLLIFLLVQAEIILAFCKSIRELYQELTRCFDGKYYILGLWLKLILILIKLKKF